MHLRNPLDLIPNLSLHTHYRKRDAKSQPLARKKCLNNPRFFPKWLSQNYPCKFSWQQHNVDSSNLPTFIKITRAKEDAIFGSKQQNINRRYDRNLSQKLKYSSVGEESRKSSEDSTISSPSTSKKRKLRLHLSSIFYELVGKTKCLRIFFAW